ncbi:MAG: Na+/H+ antiporter subunit E [Sphingorhabdus sp.]
MHVAFTVLLLLVIWMTLNRGEVGSLIVGAPVIVLGIWLSTMVPPQPRWRLRLSAVPGFAFYFVRQTFIGGWDVMMRGFDRELRLDPAFLLYRVRLPDGPARPFFLDVISLLPGTLSAEIQDDHVYVHVIDQRTDTKRELADLERRVGSLFGLDSWQ